MKFKWFSIIAGLTVLFGIPQAAYAYIGPGAGFAFIGSAFVFVLTFLMVLATLAFWPLQWAWRRVAGKRISKNARRRKREDRAD